MKTINELRKIRFQKLKAIKVAGFLPYPGETKRTHKITQTLKDFSKLSRSKKQIILVGRIRAQRKHGGACFIDIEDGSGKIQALFRENKLGQKGYKFFLENFDIGDYIEVKGVLFKTKSEEKTIEVENYKMLAKSLLPLPEKWHGLKNIEERYRKRYLDLLFNPQVKEKFEIRTKIIKEIRNFLEKEGFLEVETPILQPLYGGATARPFKTHLNALDIDLYLRISPELYLKRLLIGGWEKVYEIGKCFRNEGVDRFHNPDFTMLEFYWAYANYKDLMKFTEKIFETLIKKIFGSLKIKYQGKEIDFKPPWQRIEFSQILRKETKINLEEIHLEALKKRAKRLGVEIKPGAEKADIADGLYKNFCLPKIWQPTFIIHHPRDKSPLAKTLKQNPNKLASLQLVVGACELVWAYSELNDPIEQRKRFEEQEKIFKAGFEEAQRINKEFIEALEYGMPPAAGFGMGIDRLVALLTDSYSLREVILFPTMRLKEK